MVQKTKKMTKNANPTRDEKQQLVRHQEIKYSGIIPPPNIVDGYEKNCKGATDRILAMTENELKHKHEMERLEQESIIECRNKMLDSEIKNFKRGQYFGFLIMIVALVGSFILILKNHEAGGYTTAVGIVLFYFASVMYRHKVQNSKSKNREDEKNENGE